MNLPNTPGAIAALTSIVIDLANGYALGPYSGYEQHLNRAEMVELARRACDYAGVEWRRKKKRYHKTTQLSKLTPDMVPALAQLMDGTDGTSRIPTRTES